MRTVEFPVWLAVLITLGVALIGAAGALGAQLLNTQRERGRDALRWQRDRYTETVRLRHAHAERWREQKVTTYGLFIRQLREAESMLLTMRTHAGAEFEVAYTELRSHMYQLGGSAAEIELICSSEVERFIHSKENRGKMMLLSMPPNLASLAGTGDVGPPHVKRLEQLITTVRGYRRGFLTAARDDLVVDVEEITDLP